MRIFVAMGGYHSGDRELVGVKTTLDDAKDLCAEYADEVLAESEPLGLAEANFTPPPALRHWYSRGRNVDFEIHEFEVKVGPLDLFRRRR